MTTTLHAQPRLKSNILWNYTSGFASTFGLLLLYPLAIHIAGAEAYGLWVLSFSAIQFFTLADFGLGTGIVRQLAKIPRTVENHQERRKFVTIALLTFTSVAILLTTIFVIFFPLYLRTVPQTPALTNLHEVLIPLTAITLFVSVVGRAFNSVLWAEDRPDIERKASLVSIVLRAAGYGMVLVSGTGIMGVVLVECISLLISPAVCAVAVFIRYSWPILDATTWNRHGVPMIRLSGVLFVGTFSLLAAYQIPIYIAGAGLGLTAVTAFGALMRVYQSTRLLVSWSANPFIHPITTVPKKHLGKTMTQALALSMVVASLLAIPLALVAPSLVSVWLGPAFAFAAPAFAVLAIGVIADALIQVSSLVVNLRANPWRISLANLAVLLVSVPLVFLAVEHGDLFWAVFAMVGVPALAAPIYLFWALRLAELPLRTFLRRGPLLGLAGLVSLAVVVALISAFLHDWPAVLIAGTVEALAVASALYLVRRRSLTAVPNLEKVAV